MNLRLSTVMGNAQKLDGGAMFGNVPKAMWQKWVNVDDHNRIDLSCRALLVEIKAKRILFETGIGAYMAPKYKARFGVVQDSHVLLESLASLGLSHEDITDVVLSHLHFDHAGGLLSAYRQGVDPQLLFPQATFHVGRGAFERACRPHYRDRASFIPGLPDQLRATDRLHLIEEDSRLEFSGLDVSFFVSHGHTPHMLCSQLEMDGHRLVFAADLIPGCPWVHLPITMGYDRYPEKLIDEKEELLHDLADRRGVLFYTHDDRVAASRVHWDPERRRFRPVATHDRWCRQSWSELHAGDDSEHHHTDD